MISPFCQPNNLNDRPDNSSHPIRQMGTNPWIKGAASVAGTVIHKQVQPDVRIWYLMQSLSACIHEH